MGVLSRLRYLYLEGFEVALISGYDSQAGADRPGTAKITWLERREDGTNRLHSETFEADAHEMEMASKFFLTHIAHK